MEQNAQPLVTSSTKRELYARRGGLKTQLIQGILTTKEIEKQLQKHGKIRQPERQALLNIFCDVSMDPDWHEESVIFELYNQRIPIVEFLSLMSSDSEWSHMANKKQME